MSKPRNLSPTIEILTPDGMTRVKSWATDTPGLLITPTWGRDALHSPYTLTHVASGRIVTMHATIDDARETARKFGECGTWDGPTGITPYEGARHGTDARDIKRAAYNATRARVRVERDESRNV